MTATPTITRHLTLRQAALTIFAIAFATIAGAWIFEAAGYLPCELCLQQRWAYYAGVPIAAATTLVAWKGPPGLTRVLLLVLALIFLASTVFGVYHAGVEWKFWDGPAGCTGTVAQKAGSMDDFMKQLRTTKVVRCDEVAIRIFGLSLAGWNAVISAAMAAIAVSAISRGKN